MSRSSDARLLSSIEQHKAGRLAMAEAGYVRHLRKQPRDATALHFLGMLRTQQGQTQQGIELMRAALKSDPGYVDAWSNLGLALYKQKQYEESEQCLRKAIELAPTFVNAWFNLGTCLRAQARYTETVECWLSALRIAPTGQVYEALGRLLYRLNRETEAAELYRQWAAAEPDNAVALHMAAANGAGSAPERASDEFVRTVFDEFADSFDENLASLSYCAPRLLHEQAIEALGEGRTGLDILDLGCGTGLCAPLFRPMARTLTGVDLSAGMIAKARERGGYDELACAELTSWLRDCRACFNLVLAADVLCYFGDLEPALSGIPRILAPGGLFVFSLEQQPAAAADVPGFTLQAHGRYAHSRAYITGMLAACGLSARTVREDALRFERHERVQGYIVTACVS